MNFDAVRFARCRLIKGWSRREKWEAQHQVVLLVRLVQRLGKERPFCKQRQG
ncbi:MAG: hypothetical protein H6668_07690 [Ardenticatenaceae bacterium]|nr:hypothetical protein [Ardenticatenaceae bacterium]